MAAGCEAPVASFPDDGGPVVAVGVDVPPGMDVLVELVGLLVGVVEEPAALLTEVEEPVVLLLGRVVVVAVEVRAE